MGLLGGGGREGEGSLTLGVVEFLVSGETGLILSLDLGSSRGLLTLIPCIPDVLLGR